MYPRVVIEVAGTPVKWTDVVSTTVENTLYLAADSFDITLNNEEMLSDWLRKNQEVRIFMGYVKDPEKWSKSELNHIFTGKTDGVKPKFDSEKTVEIIGRDYSAAMIDTECNIAFKNITSSNIAEHLAKKYGLKPIITRTSGIIERDMWTDKKEWEVLQMAADLEGFVCYVSKNKELYFGERNEKDDKITDKIFYKSGFNSNCKIEFDDSSVDVINKVTVRHWTRKQKELIEATSKNDFLIKHMGQEKERIFYISKAKTKAIAKQYADKLLKEHSRNVITATGERIPGNPLLYAEAKVNVLNCGRFSGVYYVDRVVHKINKMSGYTNDFDLTSLRPENAHQYREDLYSYNDKKY